MINENKTKIKNKIIKIGADLDGVIAINHLNKADYRPYRLHEYYKKAIATKLHLRVQPDVIITGRRVHFKKLTIQWLVDNGINFNTLIMFPNKVKKSNKTLGEFKAKCINELGLDKYYEDDERIVEQLQASCPHTEIILVDKDTNIIKDLKYRW